MHKFTSRPKDLVKVEYKYIDPLFHRLITLCTPHGKENFIVNAIQVQKFIKPLKQEIIEGNLLIWVGDKQETMFSAHMDIVGSNSEKNNKAGTVDIITVMEPYDKKDYFYGAKAFLTEDGEIIEYRPSTLGADDKVGVFILLKLIEKGVNGLYVFHVGEECGLIGSRLLSTKHKNLFKDYKRCIAFDRAGYEDVIAYQRFSRCASKKFTNELAKRLNINMPPCIRYKGEVKGVFTDTASYVDIIPECTNISCGYFDQHGQNEYVDYAFLRDHLLPAALAIDYDSLPTERDPTKKVYEYDGRSYNYSQGYHYTNLKKPWKDVTLETKEWEMPEWNFKIGWVEDVDPNILEYVVTEKIVKKALLGLADKEEIGEAYFALMQLNQMLLEEVQALSVQIEMMSQPEEDQKFAELAEKVKGKIIDVPFDDDLPDHLQEDYYVEPESKIISLPERKEGVQLKLIENKSDPDLYIWDKKHLMKLLADVCKRVLFSDALKDQPKKTARYVESFLAEHHDKNFRNQFSKNKIKRMNKNIFLMAYWLNNSAKDLGTLDKELLNKAAEYMLEHQDEKGWLGHNYKQHEGENNV